jgi:hypothetical protein
MSEVMAALHGLYSYSENPVDDFWDGFGKAVLAVAGVSLFFIILSALFGGK